MRPQDEQRAPARAAPPSTPRRRRARSRARRRRTARPSRGCGARARRRRHGGSRPAASRATDGRRPVGPVRDERHAAADDPSPGTGRGRRARPGPSGSSTSSNPRARKSRSRRGPAGQPVDERQQRVRVEREPPVRRRHEDPLARPGRARRRTAAARRGRRRRARSPRSRSRGRTRRRRTAARARPRAPRSTVRKSGGEPVELGVADGRDPLGPRDRAPRRSCRSSRRRTARSVTPTSTTVVCGPGLDELEEEAELPLAAPQRDARRDAAEHRRSVNDPGEVAAGGAAHSARAPASRRRLRPPGAAAEQRRPGDRREHEQHGPRSQRQGRHFHHLLSSFATSSV